ncbi:MAG: hypothetical protein ACRENA_07520 [Vulcanimicrobiaceae bacterium]
MSLAEILDRTRAAAAEKRSPEVTQALHRAVEELRSSGILERVVKPGQTMPAFTLPNQDGALVDSVSLLEKGPLVVTFYRGRW